jgi:cold shock protein
MTERVHGTVKFFSGSKSYGFIQPDGGGSDFFVHARSLPPGVVTELQPDQRVSFEVAHTDRGDRAVSVTLAV